MKVAEKREAIGTVVALWGYPVKSMVGEELNAADLTELGVHGDRTYALLDTETDKVASAKNPRKWPNCSTTVPASWSHRTETTRSRLSASRYRMAAC